MHFQYKHIFTLSDTIQRKYFEKKSKFNKKDICLIVNLEYQS